MPADYNALDPMAFYKGAAATNDLMHNFARQKAGELLAAGRKDDAVNELNSSGDLEGANQLQLTIDQNDARHKAMTDVQRQQSTQLVQDAASVLDAIRNKEGDQAVAPAFEQLVPLFKQRGATDEELSVFRNGLAQNPGPFLATIHQLATSHLKNFTLNPGQTEFAGDGSVIASAPQTKELNAGGSLVQVPGLSPAPSKAGAFDLPPEAKAALKKGTVTHFRNGQSWTLGDDGNPVRVQ